jgi:AcrR family transcriptional regulator
MKNKKEPVDARTRVLETAWQMIAEQGSASITLVDVAKRAKVSRQTVYVNFGNRAGLLLAMVEHSDENSVELARLKTKPPGATPEQLLDHVVRAWFDYMPIVFKVARALAAAGENDVDAREAIESRWQILRAGFLLVTSALQRHGKLAPDWTPETAADWVYHMAHIDTWQHLLIERGWAQDKVIEQTIQSLLRTLCVAPPTEPTTKKL